VASHTHSELKNRLRRTCVCRTEGRMDDGPVSSCAEQNSRNVCASCMQLDSVAYCLVLVTILGVCYNRFTDPHSVQITVLQNSVFYASLSLSQQYGLLLIRSHDLTGWGLRTASQLVTAQTVRHPLWLNEPELKLPEDCVTWVRWLPRRLCKWDTALHSKLGLLKVVGQRPVLAYHLFMTATDYGR
jgi:hypothetical protein